jgi:hypothetical protein
MTRGRGGFIGTNVVPAAAAVNSAAGGLWTVREQESLKRAGTWPTVFANPASVTGLQLWLDASDANTLYDATTGGSLVAVNGAIARWEDKSGNARHATQATIGSRPTRTSSGGYGLVTFDGANDKMQLPNTAFPGVGSGGFEIFMVVRPGSGGGTLYSAQDNADGNSTIFSASLNGSLLASNALRLADNTGNITSYNVSANSVATQGANSLITSRRSSNTFTITRNGSNAGTSTRSGSFNAVSNPIGLGAYIDDGSEYQSGYTGSMCEIISYNATLTSGDRAAVESYLISKWGIT